jgi:hypothetical protein
MYAHRFCRILISWVAILQFARVIWWIVTLNSVGIIAQICSCVMSAKMSVLTPVLKCNMLRMSYCPIRHEITDDVKDSLHLGIFSILRFYVVCSELNAINIYYRILTRRKRLACMISCNIVNVHALTIPLLCLTYLLILPFVLIPKLKFLMVS